ncbi:MAG: phosphatase PAP2 family protein [Alphaproteobacteria bacterium]|nr:phosphatase PAP2 family protein [Alphaproteobacteria bacterium]
MGLGFLVLTLLLFIFPELDIEITRLFFNENDGFVYSQNNLARALFTLAPQLAIAYGIVLIICIFINLILSSINRAALYFAILVSVLVSDGFIVNYCLKNHFGRARPKQIVEFGGDAIFSRAFIISDQCNTNCSFSSGHAAGGFILSSSAFLIGQSYQAYAYWISIIFGLLVGLCRIMQGGHFPSDIFMSGFVVFITQYCVIFLYQKLIISNNTKTHFKSDI